jgi:hypothetical protein
MTAHKRRSGDLIVSYDCKQGRHETECQEWLRLAGLEDPIHCHCKCHPDDGCVPTIRRKTRRNPVCTSCYLTHPEGACDAVK